MFAQPPFLARVVQMSKNKAFWLRFRNIKEGIPSPYIIIQEFCNCQNIFLNCFVFDSITAIQLSNGNMQPKSSTIAKTTRKKFFFAVKIF